MSDKVLQGTITNSRSQERDALNVPATVESTVNRLAQEALFSGSDKKDKSNAATRFASSAQDIDAAFKNQDAATRGALENGLIDRISGDDDAGRMLYVFLEKEAPAFERKKGQGIADCTLQSEVARLENSGDVLEASLLRVSERKRAQMQPPDADHCACDKPFITVSGAARLEIKNAAEITGQPFFKSLCTEDAQFAQISRDESGKRVIDSSKLAAMIKELPEQQAKATDQMMKQGGVADGMQKFRQAGDELRVCRYLQRHLPEMEDGKGLVDQSALQRFADAYQKAMQKIEADDQAALKEQNGRHHKPSRIQSPLE